MEAPVEPKKQSTPFYCGAACAVMMLTRKGQQFTQDAAYQVIRTKNSETSFYTDPDGLTACLQSVLAQASIELNFDEVISTDTTSILQAVFASLNVNQRACPVLVKNGNHWIIVDGVIIDDAQADTPAIKTVSVVDPWPQAPDRSYVAADVFESEYLTPIRYGTKWREKLVLVKGIGASAAKVTTAQQQLMGGAGKIDEAQISKNLAALGLTQVQPILGGGLDFAPIKVKDLSKNLQYTIFALDGASSDKFGNFVLAAADDSDGRILEVTNFSDRLNYFSDAQALALVHANRILGDVSIDPGYFFFESRQLRSRFLVARRILINHVEHWLMPTGALLVSRDVFEQGGQ